MKSYRDQMESVREEIEEMEWVNGFFDYAPYLHKLIEDRLDLLYLRQNVLKVLIGEEKEAENE